MVEGNSVDDCLFCVEAGLYFYSLGTLLQCLILFSFLALPLLPTILSVDVILLIDVSVKLYLLLDALQQTHKQKHVRKFILTKYT